MKFKNPTDLPVFVTSTAGHCYTFAPGETAEVQKSLETACFDARLALIVESAATPIETTGPSETTRAQKIKEAVSLIVAKSDPKDFTTDNRVRKTAVDAMIGFKSTPDELGVAYAAVLAGT